MKNQKFLLRTISIFAFVFILASSTLKAQESNGDYLIMRTVETTMFWPSLISIAYPDGTLEEFPLEGLKKKKLGLNAVEILKKVNEIKMKGYKLVFSNGGNSDNAIVHTYLFQKTL
jgi:hypothetical protein